MRHDEEYLHAARADPGGPAGDATPDLGALRRHVLAHLTRRISVGELAARCGLSISQFSRWFRRCGGCTPYAFVVAVRIEAGQALLADGLAIADVAAAVGFADQSHFTRHFRRLVGSTPRAYVRDVARVTDRSLSEGAGTIRAPASRGRLERPSLTAR